ncbi:DUF551 domain-containing protein [Burkholderia vietnamiensis]|uniref:DUF551 domain-containing protein n=1 Tax=Burkholderia vietnamiensis (strain G4 / LMG 22486) TaxID=269482 RepID=A4JMG0_BURVG|nr:hypothetical protein Bcep1808_4499 [Burkholderia vietnamiensis G4]MCB4342465.1 DUF551 domain-containing protein [Burkholderia vietnamiensis]
MDEREILRIAVRHDIDSYLTEALTLEFVRDVLKAARRTTTDREAWISVDESLPEPGACDVLAWNNEGWHAVVHSEYVSPAFPEYTHWMPLPTAPTSDKGGA